MIASRMFDQVGGMVMIMGVATFYVVSYFRKRRAGKASHAK
jgi:hypothetical protein